MVSIEELLYSGYTKYDTLSKIMPGIPPGSFLDIYIDMCSFVKAIYKPGIQIKNYKSITSSIINMCAHYRNFFSNNNIDTTFYIVYSKNICDINNKYYIGYNSKMAYSYQTNEQIDEIVMNNVDLMNVICPYLPDIHFVYSEKAYETGAIILGLMDKVNPENERFNMVVTKDLYNYQLVAFNNTFILRPKKSKEFGDISYIVYGDNVMNVLLNERKSQVTNTLLSAGLVAPLLALSTVPERNIKSLFNTNNAVQILEDAVNDYKLKNEYNYHIKNIWEAIKGFEKLYSLGETGFEYRLKAIDIKFQSSVYSNSIEYDTLVFNNLYDPDAVRAINNKYFAENPLDLNAI